MTEEDAYWDEDAASGERLMTAAERVEIERAIEINEMRRNVDRSFERDPERARLSYTQHTATALRRRVLAVANGHAQ